MVRAVDTRTFDLFQVPQAPAPTYGSLNFETELRCTLNEMLKKTPLSRHQVAARMSDLTGHDITKAQIDAWTAESKTQWRFPFEYAPAFETATDSNDLQELFARKRGSRILVGEESLLAELGRLDQQEQHVKQRKRALQAYLRKTK